MKDETNITTFVKDNLEKISKNKLMPDMFTKSSPTSSMSALQSMQSSSQSMKSTLNLNSGKGFTTIKYIFLFLLLVFLCFVAWYYIHKYFPSWKTKITNFLNNQTAYITSKFTKTTGTTSGASGSASGGSSGGASGGSSGGASGSASGTSGSNSKPSNANLLTRAQMNNFHHKEKVSSEPEPYKYEDTLFDTNNNLNSNEILNYLLENETESNVEWCYIGESDEKRYCSISQGNKCMSGNVFPTKDLCVNPKIM